MLEILKVKDKIAGNIKAHDILKVLVDSKTLLALSGGTSPDYQKMIAQFADIQPASVCVVDERFGPPDHPDSNELVLQKSGLVTFLESKNIPLVKALLGQGFEETGKTYDFQINELFSKYQKKIGVMGIGADIHTAGIFPGSPATTSPHLVVAQQVNNKFPKRITMTLKALANFSVFVILVFGQEKRQVLAKLLDENEDDINKYPAIFYRKSTIKSFLVTDINL